MPIVLHRLPTAGSHGSGFGHNPPFVVTFQFQRAECPINELSGRYALRKQTVEPVFGIIKSVLGFRQFSLRGLKKVTGEWTLVCLAWYLKRMAVFRKDAVVPINHQ